MYAIYICAAFKKRYDRKDLPRSKFQINVKRVFRKILEDHGKFQKVNQKKLLDEHGHFFLSPHLH